jgi:hypothetical protein
MPSPIVVGQSQPRPLSTAEGNQQVNPCPSLTTVNGVGLIACSLRRDYRHSTHQELCTDTGEVLAEWVSARRQDLKNAA